MEPKMSQIPTLSLRGDPACTRHEVINETFKQRVHTAAQLPTARPAELHCVKPAQF